MIDAALNYILCNSAAVAALVGTRVWGGQLPQEPTLPALVHFQVAQEPTTIHHSGAAKVRIARFQISCIAATLDSAKSLADAVEAALDGYSGTAQTVPISWMQIAGRGPDITDTDINQFHIPVDVKICFNP